MNWQTLKLDTLTFLFEYCINKVRNSNPLNGEFHCPLCSGKIKYLHCNDQLNVWCQTDDCINFTIQD